MPYKMNDRVLYLSVTVRNKWYLVNRKIRKKLAIKYSPKETYRYGRYILPLDETQRTISEMIKSGKPFLVARLGGVESNICHACAGLEMGILKTIPRKWVDKMHINAGFFPADEIKIMGFWHLMRESLKIVDILGSMKISPEEFVVKKNLSENAYLTELECLEPYYANDPWTQALEGKKVLVIHPFADTIVQQYERRGLIFEDNRLLPEFELKVVKAVQSIAGNKTDYPDWFAALDDMYNKAMSMEFDIAIIGCGAYGLPLAAKIKKAGKQAIHLGGAVQILFGIKGARWNSVPEVRKLFNEYWVHPSLSEVPENAHKVEGGCYW